jgi:hypothetical protein
MVNEDTGDDGDDEARRPRSVARAAVNATDVTVGYGLAAARAGISAAVGMGRATTGAVAGLVERSPIGVAAGAVADALEPSADRARRQRDERVAEARAAVEAVVGRVVDQVVGVIDINGIVQDVDINSIVQGIDINGIVQGIDIEGIVDQIDINQIVDQIDIDQIVSTTEIGSLVIQSTGGVATEALDVVRSQGVSLDGVITRITDRLVRRDEGPRPEAPRRLSEATTEPQGDDGRPSTPESS